MTQAPNTIHSIVLVVTMTNRSTVVATYDDVWVGKRKTMGAVVTDNQRLLP